MADDILIRQRRRREMTIYFVGLILGFISGFISGYLIGEHLGIKKQYQYTKSRLRDSNDQST